MDWSSTMSTPLTFSEELKLAIRERNILTTKSKMKILTALNDLTKASVTERQEEMKRKVVNEIYTTELKYMHQLEVIMKYFMEPLRARSWLPDSTFNALFGNIEILYRVNGELLDEIREGTTHVAAAFSKIAPYLKLYSVYAYDYKKALEILQSMVKTNKELHQFIVSQETRPEVATSLQSLLIVPIQRIPRYRLLLQELLHHTARDDSNYNAIKDALTKIEQTAEHINGLVTEYENAEDLLELARRLTRCPVNIVIPGRKIIKQGCLMKVSRKGKSSDPRYVVLFNDVFMYCKGKRNSSVLKFSCMLPLKHCKVEPVFGTGLFRVSCQSESLLFYAGDRELGQEWIAALQSATKEYNASRWTLRKESSKRTPIRRKNMFSGGEKTLLESPDSKVSSSCFSIFKRFL